MLGENPSLYCTLLTLIANQGHQTKQNKTKTETRDTMSLGTAQFCDIGSRIGWVQAPLHVILNYPIISHHIKQIIVID